MPRVHNISLASVIFFYCNYMVLVPCKKELWYADLFMQLYSSQQALQKELGQSMVMVLLFAAHKTSFWKAPPLCLHPDILFLQPSNAKQALLEETIQKKCFGDQLGLNCNYKRKDKSMDRKIRKNDWCCAILSAKLLFLLKAALTVLRWNCLYQQKIQTITLLAWWAKFQHFGGDFCVEICTLL